MSSLFSRLTAGTSRTPGPTAQSSPSVTDFEHTLQRYETLSRTLRQMDEKYVGSVAERNAFVSDVKELRRLQKTVTELNDTEKTEFAALKATTAAQFTKLEERVRVYSNLAAAFKGKV